MATRKRGGFRKNIAFGSADERLRAMNKTLDVLVTHHLTKDEVKSLCRLWNVVYTGLLAYDTKQLLKVFHSYPNFARNTMAIVVTQASFGAAYGAWVGPQGAAAGAAVGAVLGTLGGLASSLKGWLHTDTKIFDKDKIEATAGVLNVAIDRMVDGGSPQRNSPYRRRSYRSPQPRYRNTPRHRSPRRRRDE